MHTGEPARKKAKTRIDTDTDVAGLQDDATAPVQPFDTSKDLSFASDTSTCELAQSTTDVVATVKSNSFTVLVLDAEDRLFVIDMGSLFYELYDAYQAACKATQLGPMPEAMVQKCRLAGEVQHHFLGQGTRSQNCLDKLLGFVETDSIPVLTDMCLDTKTSSARNPVVDDLHWAACCRLVCVEGYTTTAMYVTSRQEDPALFPWVLLLLLGLTVASFNGDPTCHDVTPDQLRSHPRQLQKLGETLDHMCNDWSSWTNLLPDSCFDISAQQYILMQLLDCITCSSKVLEKGFQKLQAHVTTFTSSSLTPDESSFDLELTAAWSTMIEVFMALKSKLRISTPSVRIQLLQMLLSYSAVITSASECCQAVELFAAACIRLGIPQQNQPRDPYTGEPIPDLFSNPYRAAVPQPLRQYLAGMLPGVQAMSSTSGEPVLAELLNGSVLLPSFLALPILRAVLKTADLKPGGALYRAVTTGPSELQDDFPLELRRQYLHELFPDLSVDANYEEEPDHHQLIVPRDELTQGSCPVSLTANVTRF
ncbi:hypothetical protein ABBQ38_014695 [Trebouxia sp. C0009 RCD-2024]